MNLNDSTPVSGLDNGNGSGKGDGDGAGMVYSSGNTHGIGGCNVCSDKGYGSGSSSGRGNGDGSGRG